MKKIKIKQKNCETVETIYNIADFPYEKFVYTETCRTRGRNPISYYNLIATFDIETTTIADCETPYGFMYIWQFCINDKVVMGRTWEEFSRFLYKLRKTLQLNSKKRLVIYVHYLPFEFQFMRNFITIENIFAKEKRKPLKIYGNGFEWRCSFALSNMSLAKFCENSELCTYHKIDSEENFDYSIIRTPSTELSEIELNYCYNDVRGLSQCIETLLEDDNLATIPLTNTGYVRRHFKKEMSKNPKNRTNFLNSRLDLEQYDLLRKIFRGGNTHASRFYSNVILENVHSKDIQSSYPAVMMLDYFPISKFTRCTLETEESFYKYIEKYCVIMTVEFFNIRLKSDIPVPYIDIAHCEQYSRIVNDNGRVLSADYIVYSMTEIDFKIIKDTYNYDGFHVNKAFFSRRGKLPVEFKKTLMYWYQQKTELKGVEGMEYEYLKSKNRVNSGYGMMVSAIIHPEHIFDGNEWSIEIGDREEKLADFYDKHSGFLSYQWGIYVTAHARRRLQMFLDILKDDLVYTDTDSCKYLGDYDKYFDKINKEIIEECENCEIPAFGLKDGKKYYLGVWDNEPDYLTFKTLGAKKYCSTIWDSKKECEKFGITVAGMSKSKGAITVAEKNPDKKPIENFNIGETYENVGRTVSYYNDYVQPFTINVNGEEIVTASNIGVVETTYTLGVTNEYWELICENVKNS